MKIRDCENKKILTIKNCDTKYQMEKHKVNTTGNTTYR